MKSLSKRKIYILSSILIIIFIALLLSPQFLLQIVEQEKTTIAQFQQFPVTVDPKNKIIVENPEVNAFLAAKHSLLGAALGNVGNYVLNMFETVAITINNAAWYQSVASVGSAYVVIKPGIRKEQVANVIGNALKWDAKQKKLFLTPSNSLPPELSEGMFSPGTYRFAYGTTPEQAHKIIAERFKDEVISHYGTSTQKMVPLSDALTIASLIQRETLTTDGMRLISGIMWNRLFTGMKLQIDSTLQYAKADKQSVATWWPPVLSSDKYIKSPYNTYLNKGLPPTPIANPSVAAILAALNPIETTCLFYFNDKTGAFHCSDTYPEHVALLKKYY